MIQGGIAYGAILFSELTILYINPMNLSPDVDVSSSEKYVKGRTIRIYDSDV